VLELGADVRLIDEGDLDRLWVLWARRRGLISVRRKCMSASEPTKTIAQVKAAGETALTG